MNRLKLALQAIARRDPKALAAQHPPDAYPTHAGWAHQCETGTPPLHPVMRSPYEMVEYLEAVQRSRAHFDDAVSRRPGLATYLQPLMQRESSSEHARADGQSAIRQDRLV